jgi:uncharacterized protein (TIGR01777 family)
MKALLTGATGLIGRELLKHLDAPVVLTRAAPETRGKLGSNASAWSWQPETQLPPLEAFVGVDAVFHLAGEPVAEGRWSAEKKQRIRTSRVLGTRNLVSALSQLPVPPRVFVSASAVGYYGHRGDLELDEDSAPGEGFLAEVCQAWEAEACAAEQHGIRVVRARLGVVLAREGGALARMLPPFRMGVGGKLGDGSQWTPWVHVDDVVGLLLHAASDTSLQGPLNIVSPEPVTNAKLTRQLGRVLNRPALLSVPRLALRLAFGELSTVLLQSQRVLPRVAQASAYRFAYPQLGGALSACING